MVPDRRELEIAPQFTSKIEILSGALLDIDVLPEILFRLGQLSLGTLDVPSALQRIREVVSRIWYLLDKPCRLS
jgi:hypothetical protein